MPSPNKARPGSSHHGSMSAAHIRRNLIIEDQCKSIKERDTVAELNQKTVTYCCEQMSGTEEIADRDVYPSKQKLRSAEIYIDKQSPVPEPDRSKTVLRPSMQRFSTETFKDSGTPLFGCPSPRSPLGERGRSFMVLCRGLDDRGTHTILHEEVPPKDEEK
ncbi:hypothetical protein MMC19_006467 [Ptychographa xylographoides]|nr:hypothetical protein [Ptychographa xylographoides]